MFQFFLPGDQAHAPVRNVPLQKMILQECPLHSLVHLVIQQAQYKNQYHLLHPQLS